MVFESRDRQTREEAAFFYRGASETIAEGVVFFPSFGTSTAFICDGALLLVDTAAAQFAGPRRRGPAHEPLPGPRPGDRLHPRPHRPHHRRPRVPRRRRVPRPPPPPHRRPPRPPRPLRPLPAPRPPERLHQPHPVQLPGDRPPLLHRAPRLPRRRLRRRLAITVGGELFELHHARGETDDETWVWCPARRILCTGDTFVWSSPNAGNPYKVQRYALDWARALERWPRSTPCTSSPATAPPSPARSASRTPLPPPPPSSAPSTTRSSRR